MAFPVDALDVTVEAYYDSTWNDITTDVFDRDGNNSIVIERGRANGAGLCDPSHASLKLNNVNGKYSPRNPNSELYGKIGRNTPIRISYEYDSVTYIRFTGEVTAWPSRWDPSGSDVWVELEAWGILRRLGQGASPLKSAPERAITFASPAPVAWWPLTLGKLRNTSPPRIPSGGPPMLGVVDPLFGNSLPNWSAGDLAPWLSAGVNLDDGGLARANVPAPPAGWANTDGWTVDVSVNVGKTRPVDESPTPLIYLTGNGRYPSVDWSLDLQPAGGIDPSASVDTVHLVFTEQASSTSSSATVLASMPFLLFDDNPHQLQLIVDQTGADIPWIVVGDGVLLGSGTVSTETLQWPGMVELNSFRNDRYDKYAVADVIIWGSSLTPPDIATPTLGHTGELVTDRIARLGDEEGISIVITGTSDARMGPQRIATLLELLDDCAAVDRGLLFEQREAVGLAYRTNTSRYNQ